MTKNLFTVLTQSGFAVLDAMTAYSVGAAKAAKVFPALAEEAGTLLGSVAVAVTKYRAAQLEKYLPAKLFYVAQVAAARKNFKKAFFAKQGEAKMAMDEAMERVSKNLTQSIKQYQEEEEVEVPRAKA